jgi:hypothetical protein
VAFDANVIDGHHVGTSPSTENRFMNACRAHGATEVINEVSHIHCGWPA